LRKWSPCRQREAQDGGERQNPHGRIMTSHPRLGENRGLSILSRVFTRSSGRCR
jgi:hypothetical protein